MENIQMAAKLFRIAQAEYDQITKKKEEARKHLLEAVGNQPFEGHGVKIINGTIRKTINWMLATAHYNITEDMLLPFTKTIQTALRVSAVREVHE